MSVCSNYIQEISDLYDLSASALTVSKTHSTWLADNRTYSSFNTTYRTHVAYAITWMSAAVNYLIWCNQDYLPPKRIPYVLKNCVGGNVDMTAILTAMWNCTQLQPLLFITYIDAMRSAIYDKWVDQQTLQDYVRHFTFDVVGG